MLYLKITSPGVADHRSLTLLGASGSRGNSKAIGMFGTGSCNSIALCARHNIGLVICPGNLKMEFFCQPEHIAGRTFNRIKVKYAGQDIEGRSKNTTEDLGFLAEMGAIDWRKPTMAFREFVSNAIDSVTLQGLDEKSIKIEVVDKIRAKAGFTSVFLEYTAAIQEAYANLPKLFIHFSQFNLNEKILQKEKREKGIVYRKGVAVCSLESESLFDYNLGESLSIDESRNCKEWEVKYEVGREIGKAPINKLKRLIGAIIQKEQIWEEKITPTVEEFNQENWKAAFSQLYGEKAAIVSNPLFMDHVKRKGFEPVLLENPKWYQACKAAGIRCGELVLSAVEMTGKNLCEASHKIVEMTDKVWNLLSHLNMTDGKNKPKVRGFTEFMKGDGEQLWGYYERGGDTIFIENSLNNGTQLFKCVLEELTHYITQSGDGERVFQDFCFRITAELAMNGFISYQGCPRFGD